MKEQWQKLAARIDAFSLRERALIFLATCAVLLGLWLQFFLTPFEARAKQAKEQIAAIEQEMTELRNQTTLVAARAGMDVNKPLREQEAALVAKIKETDTAIQARTGDFITPPQMRELLEDLLNAHKGLRLVRLESLEPQALEIPGVDKQTQVAPVYRHGLVLEFTGDYLTTLQFLQAVEQLPWQVFWDHFELKVERHPEAKVILRVHTLSGQEAWIGV